MALISLTLRRTLRAVGAALAIASIANATQPVRGAECTREQLGAAIDLAGEQLRQLTMATQPTVQAKLQRLKAVRGWSDSDYEEKGYAALEDERTAKLDATANDLLARMDQLGGDDGIAAPECGRIAEIEATSVELQATAKTKSQYVLSRLDQLIAEGQPGATATTALSPAAPTPAPAPALAQAPAASRDTPPPPAAAAKEPATTLRSIVTAPPVSSGPTQTPPADNRWSTQTRSLPAVQSAPPQGLPPPTPPAVVANATALPAANVATPPAPPAEEFTIDEIVEASRGLFGQVSGNLARVLEHAFAKSGRPTGYILGQETGGAFVAGLRFGQGTLYLRRGDQQPVFWHGPSLGADVGAQGASTLFLVYKMRETRDVFSTFTGVEGSAFVVGGVGLTFLTNGEVNMAPIRSGIGLRVGANLGYLRFTSKPTWNPF